MTILEPPTPELQHLLVDTLGIRIFHGEAWQRLFERAGFVDVRCTLSRIRLWEQMASHVRVDGVGGYLAAAVRALADARVRGTFINRALLKAARRYASSVGYGLYTGRKGR